MNYLWSINLPITKIKKVAVLVKNTIFFEKQKTTDNYIISCKIRSFIICFKEDSSNEDVEYTKFMGLIPY